MKPPFVQYSVAIGVCVVAFLVPVVTGQTRGIGNQNIEGCYTSRDYRNPGYLLLPQSLDNLLYLIEKLENSPSFGQKNASTFATLLLKKYQKNGVEDEPLSGSPDAVGLDQNEEYKQILLQTFYPNVQAGELDDTVLNMREKCSLHWLLSYRFNQSKLDSGYYVEYPVTEGGVVDTGMYGLVNMGLVIQGVANSGTYRRVPLSTVADMTLVSQEDLAAYNIQIDSNYATTIAGELAQIALQTTYTGVSDFRSTGYINDTLCPTTFMVDSSYNFSAIVSYPKLRGAIDGWAISKYLTGTFANTGVQPRLSQILRMYYGNGLQSQQTYTACERKLRLGDTGELSSQTAAAAMFLKTRLYYQINLSGPQSIQTQASRIVGQFSQMFQDSCNSSYVESTCGIKHDIIFVMDTSSNQYTDNFRDQREFIAGVINQLGVDKNGSHAGVLTTGNSGRQVIRMENDQNGGNLRCDLLWRLMNPSTVNIGDTIRAAQEAFRNMPNREYVSGVTPGRVLAFIYMQNGFGSEKKNDIEGAIRAFRGEHPDVTILAIGKDKPTLQSFVTNIDTDAFIKPGEALVYQVPNFMKRLCSVGQTVRFPECYQGTNDGSKMTGDVYVLPKTNYKQWVVMPSQYFNLSRSLVMTFTMQHGTAMICRGRYKDSVTDCRTATSGTPQLVWGPNEPCDDYDDFCPAYYYTIQATNNAADIDRCLEKACDTLDQVRVTVSHTGARCAGCTARSSWQLLFIVAIIALLKFH